jgi:hypothetical protein
MRRVLAGLAVRRAGAGTSPSTPVGATCRCARPRGGSFEVPFIRETDPPFARRDQERDMDRFQPGRTTTVTDLLNWLRAEARRAHGATARGVVAAGHVGVGA